MNIRRWLLPMSRGGVWVCSVLLSAPPASMGQTATAMTRQGQNSQPAALQAFAQHPLSFERNVGQASPDVKYVSRGPGYSLSLSSNQALLAVYQGDDLRHGLARGKRPPIAAPTAIQMSLAGANPNAAVTGLDVLPGKVNYLLGNDAKRWHLHVPNYARVKYDGVYPGIDLVYYGNQQQLEYDFLVAPGANPNRIDLAFDGAKSLRVDDQTGDLVIQTANGAELRHQRPVVYQMAGGRKVEVDASYRVFDQNHAAFTLASYDPRKSLVIDPTLVFTTTLAGSNEDFPAAIALDGSGNAYITGLTFSSDFPQVGSGPGGEPSNCSSMTAGAFCLSAFVSKISPEGAVLFSSYIGGDSSTFALGIAADATGAFITGYTAAKDFLTNTKYAFGGNNAFVAKLDPSGDSYQWVVGLGGETLSSVNGISMNVATSIALDSSHAAYITGYTTAVDFPTTEYFSGQQKSWQPVYGGGQDAFAAKVEPEGTLDGGYSTYIGGADFDSGNGIAVDSSGQAYVTGETYSTNFPAIGSQLSGASPTGGGYTAFVVKLLKNGSGALYSKYLGGYENAYFRRVRISEPPTADAGLAIAVNGAGEAYVTGTTCSPDFFTTPGVLQTSQPVPCSSDNLSELLIDFSGFVSILDASGAPLYSTFLGGNILTGTSTIAFNSNGEVYVGGYTGAGSLFGTANPLYTNGTTNTGFVVKLSPNLSQAVFTNFIGSQVTGVAVSSPFSRFGITLPIGPFQVYATGAAFRPGTNNQSDTNLDAFVSMWKDGGQTIIERF